MKNFLEATVIKPTLTVKVKFTVTPMGQVPCLVKLGNNTLYEDTIKETKTFELDLPLTDPIDLSVRIYRYHPDAVVLTLAIDEHEILPKYQHLSTPPTDYIDFNDQWNLHIPNFYPWLHEITGQGWIS
jgi:hypothetical protein